MHSVWSSSDSHSTVTMKCVHYSVVAVGFHLWHKEIFFPFNLFVIFQIPRLKADKKNTEIAFLTRTGTQGPLFFWKLARFPIYWASFCYQQSLIPVHCSGCWWCCYSFPAGGSSVSPNWAAVWMMGQRWHPGREEVDMRLGAHTDFRQRSLRTDLPPIELGLKERNRTRKTEKRVKL